MRSRLLHLLLSIRFSSRSLSSAAACLLWMRFVPFATRIEIMKTEPLFALMTSATVTETFFEWKENSRNLQMKNWKLKRGKRQRKESFDFIKSSKAILFSNSIEFLVAKKTHFKLQQLRSQHQLHIGRRCADISKRPFWQEAPRKLFEKLFRNQNERSFVCWRFKASPTRISFG